VDLGGALGAIGDFLLNSFQNRGVYLLLVFIYGILVAVILPIPIEIALFLPAAQKDYVFFLLVALDIGAGKGVGAYLIFRLGLRVEDNIRFWIEPKPTNVLWVRNVKGIFKRIVEWWTRFIMKTRYVGLFILLSIPLMSDTLPIYLYALFNKEGGLLQSGIFVAVNFFAGVLRSFIVLTLFVFWGTWIQ